MFWCFQCWLTTCKCMLGACFLTYRGISITELENINSSKKCNCSSWPFEMCDPISAWLLRKRCEINCKSWEALLATLKLKRWFLTFTAQKKWSFRLRIMETSLENLMENFIFCAVLWLNVTNNESAFHWLNFSILYPSHF